MNVVRVGTFVLHLLGPCFNAPKSSNKKVSLFPTFLQVKNQFKNTVTNSYKEIRKNIVSQMCGFFFL